MDVLTTARQDSARRRQPPAAGPARPAAAAEGAAHAVSGLPAAAAEGAAHAVSGLPASAAEGAAHAVSGLPAAADLPLEHLRTALTIRRVEERLLALFAEGKLTGTVHTCIGQEWIAVAVMAALTPADAIFSHHRGHGHYLARTGDVAGLIAELMGRTTGVCGGLGGSQHLCKESFYTNGIQGGIVPCAAGLALARKLADGDAIAVVFIGDGTLGEGVLYETLNIAARWSLPLLIVVEDNGIAQSTPQSMNLAGSVAGRAAAFGIPCAAANTQDPARLLATARHAVEQVRATRSPRMLHVRTARLKAHSKGDDTRDAAEVAALEQADPLNRLLANPPDAVTEILQEVDRYIDRAVADAEAAPATRSQGAAHEVSGLRCDTAVPPVQGAAHAVSGLPATADEPALFAPPVLVSEPAWHTASFEPRKVVDAIRQALTDAMADDERIVLIGEDVLDPYGGAFKVTAGLSTRFPRRVLGTPISEAAIVGLGNGLALAGRRPVVEIMFADFLTLALDQWLNHAAKFAAMYAGQVRVPLLLRTPAGGYRGYGPTHSQSPEKHFLGIPGTRVIALHGRCDVYRLYRVLLAEIDRPTLLIENKLLYGRTARPDPPAGWSIEATDDRYPTLRLRPVEALAARRSNACDLTLLAAGGMAELAEKAALDLLEREELACEVLLPTGLYPLDLGPILASVRQTGRLLICEEGQGFAGFGSEVIAQLSRHDLGRPWRADRIHAAPTIIPAARQAELDVLPSLDTLTAAACRLIA